MSLALALSLAGAGGCATTPAEPVQPMDFMMYHTRLGPSRSVSDEARLAAKSALAAAEAAVQERRFTPAAAAYLDAARAYLETSNRAGARASEKDAQRLRENRLILYTNAALCLMNERQKAEPERIGDTRKLLMDAAAADPELAETLRTMAAELPRPPSYLRSGPH